MSKTDITHARLTRRNWMLLSASSLAGCGGGAGVAGLPGTGGTGIYVQGSIAGFGSVIINSIKFDDSQATVLMNGGAVSSANLRLGMVAAVQGERGADATQGTARSIEVWSLAQGLVASVHGSGFEVAGVKVLTNPATACDGLGRVGQLSAGMRVVVWGLQSGVEGISWTATRVALATDAQVVSTGTLARIGSRSYLNGLLLTGALADGIADATLVRVQGTLSPTQESLQVTGFKLHSPWLATQPQGESEIEGVVASVLSATRFMMGGIEVDAAGARLSPAGARIAVGARIQVEGFWQGAVLKAVEVEVGDEQGLREASIEAVIEQFTSLSYFILRGQRCDASGAVLVGSGSLNDVRLGAKVKLQGSVDGDLLRVRSLELLV